MYGVADAWRMVDASDNWLMERHTMIRLLIALLLSCGVAQAQTAANVQPGYMSPAGQNGCPSTSACFVAYGASVPVTAVISQGPLVIVALDAATVVTGVSVTVVELP